MEQFAVNMQNITKIFFGNKANDCVSFKLRKGSIHGLLGENGAGKTTLMNILYGLYQQDEGNVYINGKKQKIDSPTKALKLGIGMVHQHFMLVRPFSVAQNIMLGHKSSKGIFLDTKRVEKKLSELSDKYYLKVDPTAKIWQLSVGEQQRVEILSTIYQGAEILILDEPTAVLTPQESEALFDILRSMRDEGKSIILITHKLEEILSVADEVTVLRDGKLIGSKNVDQTTTKAELAKMMVGREVVFTYNDDDIHGKETALKLENLCAKNNKELPALNNFSLEIRKGEIVGLAGVDGNGQKELCEVITGLRKLESGNVVLNNESIKRMTPKQIIEKGIAHIPEDRHHVGLAMGFSIANNLIIKNYNKAPFSKNMILDRKAIDINAEKVIEDYQVKANSHEDIVKDLSGGNQQKIILGRELMSRPKVLIAAHPTRGLDIGATQYVREQIIDAKKAGTGVMLVSADLEEILQLSDKIAVIFNGELMGILPKGSDIKKIGLLMMGQRLEVEVDEK